MFTYHNVVSRVLVVAAALYLSGPLGVACAESPRSITRTFAFKTQFNPTTQLPDFSAQSSIAVVVAPRSQTSLSTLQFVPDDGVDLRLDGTTWFYQQASHLTVGHETLSGAFLWQVTDETPEPPPSGSFTMTGAGTVQGVFLVRLCANDDCGSTNNGKYSA